MPACIDGENHEYGEPLMTAFLRRQISSSAIDSDVFQIIGNTSIGDLGMGAIYTHIGAPPTGPMAIQDAAGAWFNLVISGGFVNVGWFGAKGDGVTEDMPALRAANDYLISIGGGTLYFPKGHYKSFIANPSGMIPVGDFI